MNFDMETAKGIATTVATKANEIVRDLNDRFDDLSEDTKGLIYVGLTSVAFILFSTFWTTVTLVAMVAFRAYPRVMDRFAPNAFDTAPVAEVVDLKDVAE